MGLDSMIEFLKKNANIPKPQNVQVSVQSSEKLYPETFDGLQQQRYPPTQIISSQSNIVKPKSGENHGDNLRITAFPVQCNPKIEDQASRRLPELRSVSPNDLHEVPRSKKNVTAGSSEKIHSITHCYCPSKSDLRKRTASPTPNQSCEPIPKKPSSASDNSINQEKIVEKFNHPYHDESSNSSKSNPQYVLQTKNNFPITLEMTIESKNIAEEMLMNKFDTLYNKIDTVIYDKSAFFIVCNALHEYVKIFKNVMDDCNNYELKIKEQNSVREPLTEPVILSSPEDTSVTSGNNRQNGNNDNQETNKTTKKLCSFTLPPDYDPNDTRWTLKCQAPGPGIIELIPNSKIYIEANRFSYCKLVAKDCKTLARMLLMEIFSLSALGVCSLTGARAAAFDLDGSDVTPGLDEHARSVLLMFVEEYGIKKRWRVPDTQSIVNSIRNKIQQIRSKHGSIVER